MKNNSMSNPDKSILNPMQLICVVCSIGLGAFIPFNGIGQEMARDIWVSFGVSLIMGFIFILILMANLKLCPTQSIVGIHREAFGKILGTAMNIVYLLLLVYAVAYYIQISISFWCINNNQMEDYFSIVALALILSCFGAYFGIGTIARVCVIILFFAYFIIFFATFFLVPEMKLERFLPLWEFSWPMALKTGWKFFAYQFFFMPLIFTFMRGAAEKKKQGKSLVLGFLLASSFYLINTFRNVAVLGDTIFLQQSVAMKALRISEWKSPIIRLEDLGLFMMITIFLSFQMISYYGISVVSAEIFKVKNYKNLLLPTGILLFVVLVVLFKITASSNHFLLAPVFEYVAIILFALTITTLPLLVVKRKISKKHKKKK